jgi:hypothetical protein
VEWRANATGKGFSLDLDSTNSTRPRQREVLIKFCRKSKIDEALRPFKKIYLEVVHQIIDHLRNQ